MALLALGINSILGTGLDATSNPAPNTLTLVQPYTNAAIKFPYLPPFTPSAAWITQGNKALFPKGRPDGQGLSPIRLEFVPSNGSAVTYTAAIWFFNPITGTWIQPTATPSVNYTGSAYNTIDDAGPDAIFIQLSSISAGTISIYFNGDAACTGFEVSGGEAAGFLGGVYAYQSND